MITTSESEEPIFQLAKQSSGSHVHTANKASFYLRKIADKPKAKFSTCTADEFVAAVRAALYRNEWQRLGDCMARWW